MNNYVLSLIALCFFLYPSQNYAMQPNLKPIPSIILKEITVSETSYAIASNLSERVIVMDDNHCKSINYHQEDRVKESWDIDRVIGKKKLYTHQNNGTKILTCFDEISKISQVFLCKGLQSQYLRNIKNKKANILFSSTGSYFYTFNNKKLQYHNLNLNGKCVYSEDCMIDGNVIISEKLSELPSFLFSDDKTLYELELYNGSNKTRKVCDFFCELNWDHWVYTPRFGLLCALTTKNSQLYIADILKSRQTIFPLFNFTPAALVIHPNKRVIGLLSADRDKICYFDCHQLQSLLITEHTVSENGLVNSSDDQILACSPDGQDMMVLLSGKCLIIKVPAWIREIDAYEKYSLCKKLLLITQDLQWMITKILLSLLHIQ